jgi:hypothetical protein
VVRWRPGRAGPESVGPRGQLLVRALPSGAREHDVGSLSSVFYCAFSSLFRELSETEPISISTCRVRIRPLARLTARRSY